MNKHKNIMKRFLLTVAALFAVSALFAQTAEQIIAKMDKVTENFDSEGVYMIMDMKIPILGTISTQMYTLGQKSKATTKALGEESIIWSDEKTEWIYDSKKNEITIKNADPSDSDDEMSVLDGITDGYDVEVKKEDAKVWQIACTKSKDNPDKDAPKKMTLKIAKGTYLPVSISMTAKGVTVVLRNFKPGVKEADVTFDPSLYPNATIVDKR